MLGIDTKPEYEWIIKDPLGDTLAYKKPEEEPVFIDSEKAVLQCVVVIDSMKNAHKNTQNLLADLSRHL